MTPQHSPEDALRRRQIMALSEPELDRVADAVGGAIVHPLATNLEKDFVKTSAGDTPRARLQRSSDRGEKQTAGQ